MTTPTKHHRPPMAAILVVPLVVALFLTLFAWPSARLGPRDLPIGVAGPPPAVEKVEQGLPAEEGAFEIHPYDTEAAARAAVATLRASRASSTSPSCWSARRRRGSSF